MLKLKNVLKSMQVSRTHEFHVKRILFILFFFFLKYGLKPNYDLSDIGIIVVFIFDR